jgi:hypothetical protein
MDVEEVYWSLSKPVEKKQIDGLTFEQARFFVSELPVSEHHLWMVWREGFTKWIPLLECSDLIKKPRSGMRRVSPPLPPDETNEFSVINNLAEMATGKQIDQRLSRRFVKSFSVLVETKGSPSFKTKLVNISVGGMKVAEAIPEGFGVSFNATIQRADGEELKIYCKVIKSSARLRVKFLEVDKPRVLQSWLIDSKTS